MVIKKKVKSPVRKVKPVKKTKVKNVKKTKVKKVKKTTTKRGDDTGSYEKIYMKLVQHKSKEIMGICRSDRHIFTLNYDRIVFRLCFHTTKMFLVIIKNDRYNDLNFYESSVGERSFLDKNIMLMAEGFKFYIKDKEVKFIDKEGEEHFFKIDGETKLSNDWVML